MRYTAVLLGIFVSTVAGGAQAQTTSAARVERRAERAVVAPTTDVDRAQIEREIKELRGRLGDAAERFLQPAASDLAHYRGFLRQSDTGLIRLLPRETYDYAIPIRGGGAYYSFTQRTHEYGNGSDISLEQGKFIAGGFPGASFGFITALADVALDDVTLDTPGVSYLAAFETPLEEPEARVQQRRGWRPGFEADGFTYARDAPAVANKTYALRSVNYGASDVLVAFRVVREDADGSRVLLWRVLKEFPKPELKRADER